MVGKGMVGEGRRGGVGNEGRGKLEGGDRRMDRFPARQLCGTSLVFTIRMHRFQGTKVSGKTRH